MSQAFEGLRVIELGQIYNGPYVGLLLAQHGADVIKVEPPGGEKLRYRSSDHVETHEFLMLNSNKRSVVVDLRTDDGRDVLVRLLVETDVLIENFAPGTMRRLGLDPEELCERFPRLVVASGKGYGSEGPYADMMAMDITVQAMAGSISSTGFSDGDAVKAGPAFADFSGGTHLFGAIVTALYQRERTGRGQLVEVSMHDTLYPTLASALGGLHNDANRELPERTGNRHSGLAVAPYNVYPALDGAIAIISLHDRHYDGIVNRPELDHLRGDPRFRDQRARVDNMDELDAAIAAWTATLSRDDLAKQLQSAGVPFAPVKTVAEVDCDPHLLQRGMIQTVEHPLKGPVPVPGSPLRLGGSTPVPTSVAPALGASTQEVLTELAGLDEATIARLREDGVVA